MRHRKLSASIPAPEAAIADVEQRCDLVITGSGAATQRSFNLQGIQATTNPVAPWIIVNGPIARTLGINSGMNCLGQGSRANATIGRALRLVL
ncbi:MAG: hypothetical protein V7640_2945, partial [Betaproteobacteria bacterium]